MAHKKGHFGYRAKNLAKSALKVVLRQDGLGEGKGQVSQKSIDTAAKKRKNKQEGIKKTVTPLRNLKGTMKERMKAQNVERHGKTAISNLAKKGEDFKKMRSGKMTKEAFINKYPNSITAREANKRKNRRKSTVRKSNSTNKKKLTNNQIKYPTGPGGFRGF
jgi:hypothetical protein